MSRVKKPPSVSKPLSELTKKNPASSNPIITSLFGVERSGRAATSHGTSLIICLIPSFLSGRTIRILLVCYQADRRGATWPSFLPWQWHRGSSTAPLSAKAHIMIIIIRENVADWQHLLEVRPTTGVKALWSRLKILFFSTLMNAEQYFLVVRGWMDGWMAGAPTVSGKPLQATNCSLLESHHLNIHNNPPSPYIYISNQCSKSQTVVMVSWAPP